MGAVATESGGSLAHLALQHYDAGVWQCLHKRGLAKEVDLGAPDLEGVTPAMLAADREHKEILAGTKTEQDAGLVAEILAAGDLGGVLLTIEGVDATDLKHDGIALGSDGMLYCAPANAQEVLIVDPKTRDISRLPVPPGQRKYSGIARGRSGSLYCAPFNAGAVLVIDPDRKVRTLPLPLDGPCLLASWFSAVSRVFLKLCLWISRAGRFAVFCMFCIMFVCFQALEKRSGEARASSAAFASAPTGACTARRTTHLRCSSSARTSASPSSRARALAAPSSRASAPPLVACTAARTTARTFCASTRRRSAGS